DVVAVAQHEALHAERVDLERQHRRRRIDRRRRRIGLAADRRVGDNAWRMAACDEHHDDEALHRGAPYAPRFEPASGGAPAAYTIAPRRLTSGRSASTSSGAHTRRIVAVGWPSGMSSSKRDSVTVPYFG